MVPAPKKVPDTFFAQRKNAVLEIYQSLIKDQYEAVLCMLAEAIHECPEGLWREPVAEWRFCQVAFHALFYADVYLGTSLDTLRDQSFHLEHADTFADYPDLQPQRPQATYERPFIESYLQHCRAKAKAVIAGETERSLAQRPGFEWLGFSRAEVHVYNIRHIHHHAAQLSLLLRLKTGEGVGWQSSGWTMPNEQKLDEAY